MVTVSLQPLAFGKVFLLIAAIIGLTSAVCFADPVFMNVRSAQCDGRTMHPREVRVSPRENRSRDLALLQSASQSRREISDGWSRCKSDGVSAHRETARCEYHTDLTLAQFIAARRLAGSSLFNGGGRAFHDVANLGAAEWQLPANDYPTSPATQSVDCATTQLASSQVATR